MINHRTISVVGQWLASERRKDLAPGPRPCSYTLWRGVWKRSPTCQTAEKDGLEAAQATDTTPPAVRRHLERSLRSQRRALARLSGEAVKIIEQDSGLKLRFELLICVHGSIAAASAIRILAELAVLSEDLDVRQYVAYAGLDPRECTLGHLGA